MDVQEHLAARQAHGDLAGLGGARGAVSGIPHVGEAGEQSQGGRGPGDGIELLAELRDALAGGAQRGHQALVLGRQADGLGAGLTQLVADEVRGRHLQRLSLTGVGRRRLRHGERRPGRHPRSR